MYEPIAGYLKFFFESFNDLSLFHEILVVEEALLQDGIEGLAHHSAHGGIVAGLKRTFKGLFLVLKY